MATFIADNKEADASTMEVADIQEESQWRFKEKQPANGHTQEENTDTFGGRSKVSCRDTVIVERCMENRAQFETFCAGDISDDDIIEESNNPTWFGMRMTCEEKIEVRIPWCNSLIIKLVGRSIRYHYLWHRIQAMWRTQGEPFLIDLGFTFYIVKLAR